MPPAPPDPDSQAADPADAHVPVWVDALGLPVWITGADGTLRYVNRRAEELLARSADQCIGRACHRVIDGRDESGRGFCSARCAVVREAETGDEITPHTLEIPHEDGSSRWTTIVVIPVAAREEGGRPWLVHCAVPVDRAHRLEAFLHKVASRTPHDGASSDRWPQHRLTAREREVLELLAQDKDTAAIASELHVSHVTVRNHVQHILEKLDAHSILEAVARHLLDRRR